MAEHLTSLAKSRPTRKRVNRLSAEMLREMFDSDTDCSDLDPDFDVGKSCSKAGHGVSSSYCQRALEGSPRATQSSEDTSEPDMCLPQKKLAKRVKREKKSSGSDPAETLEHTPALALKGMPGASRPAKAPEHASQVSPANMPEARAAKGLRGQPKKCPPWAPQNGPSFTPSVPPQPDLYTEWNGFTSIMQPTHTPGKTGYRCCVQGCRSGETSDKDGLWLFALPQEEEHMSAWDERLPIDHERNRPLSPRVCFRHFERSDFVRQQRRLVGLKHDAMPIKTERTECSM